MAQGIEILVDLLASGTPARGRQCSTVKSSESIKRVMILAATLCCPPGRPGHMLQLQDLAKPEAPASPQQLSPQAEASMTTHARGSRSLTATTPPPPPPATLRCRPSGTSGPDPTSGSLFFRFLCLYVWQGTPATPIPGGPEHAAWRCSGTAGRCRPAPALHSIRLVTSRLVAAFRAKRSLLSADEVCR